MTVIICAHNEGPALERHLPKVLQQRYRFPDGRSAFEVIVANDGSTDDTSEILDRLAGSYPELRPVHIEPGTPRSFPGKKFPLSKGLAAARYDWIVCTDADCEPAGDAWIGLITAPLQKGKQIVAGFGGMNRERGWLNVFIRYETVHTFLQYQAYTKAGVPYMAVGRNLAATKEMFMRAQTSPVWSALPSGDDDLLIRLCATGSNMEVVAHPASFTWSAAKGNLSDYLNQKRRHVSTGKYYAALPKLMLSAYAIAQLLWWIAFACCVAMLPAATGPLLCLLAVQAALLCILRSGASRLHVRTTVAGWLLFSFCWVLYNTVLAPYILWKSKQRWK